MMKSSKNRQPTLRDEYAARTREAVVAAARALFAKRGYAATSVARVAKAARATHGAVYAHFDGKESLFEAVWRAVQGEWHAAALSCMAEARPASERLGALLRVLSSYADHGDFRQIVLVDGPWVLRSRGLATHDYGRDAVVQALRGSSDAGHLSDGAVEAFAELYQGLLFAAGRCLALGQPRADVTEEIRSLVARFPLLLDLGPAREGSP